MPDLDDYVIDPGTGRTVRLPTALAPVIGLPRAAPKMEPIDYGSTQEYAAGDYYDDERGALINGVTGQPMYQQPRDPRLPPEGYVETMMQQGIPLSIDYRTPEQKIIQDAHARKKNVDVEQIERNGQKFYAVTEKPKKRDPRALAKPPEGYVDAMMKSGVPLVLDYRTPEQKIRQDAHARGKSVDVEQIEHDGKTFYAVTEKPDTGERVAVDQGSAPMIRGVSPEAYVGRLGNLQAGVAHIAQATGPMGTIGQIGKFVPSPDMNPGSLPAQPADAYQPPPEPVVEPDVPPPPPEAPIDPTKPEQAGIDLQQQGLELGEKAAMQGAAADERAAGFEERAIAARNAAAERVRAETAKEEAARQKRFEEMRAQKEEAVDRWANYKVDPGRRWKDLSTGRKIAAGIAVALSALGDALQRKSGPNVALGIINKAIEDDVNMQVAERQQLGEVAQQKRTSLDDYRRETGDWREARQLKLAEEYKRTADDIERIAATLKGGKAKANALAMVGEYRAKHGALINGVATAAWSREMKMADAAEQKRQAKVAEAQRWKGLSLQEKEIEERKAERKADRDAKLAEFNAKSQAEQAKMVRELGITDPNTGKLYIDANGQPVFAATTDEAKEIRKTVKHSQTALSAVDELRKQAIALGPSAVKGKVADVFNTKLGLLQLQIKEAYKLGALDTGSTQFLDKLTGGDPTKITTAGVAGMLGIGNESGERVAARLQALGEGIERGALDQMGNPAGVKFRRAEELAPTTANKAAAAVRTGTPTTAAAVRAQERGTLAKGLQDAESLLFGTEQQYKKAERAAEESGSLKYPGFRPDKEQALDTLIAGAKAGDEQSTKRLLEMAGDQKTPGLSDATMTLIEGHAPELLPRALAELPKEKREQRQAGYGVTLPPSLQRSLDVARQRSGGR